ncbi:MAG: FliH/SctL family protein [Gammaproteobacteria bacterium]|nr:FliH/SctL family protein [Gammaproteobacteria bacterium]MDH5800651.1 FliH/SctL family protein [Gammaproteobacteria bacterium]
MTSIIRSPRVSSQGRVLSVPEKAAVSKNPLDYTEVSQVNKNVSDRKRDLKNYQVTDILDINRNEQHASDNEELEQLKQQLDAVTQELEQLKQSLSDERESAREEGFQAGVEQGRDSVTTEWKSKQDSINDLIQELEKKAGAELSDNEDQFVEVIVAALLKVFGQVLETKQGIVAVVRHTVAQVQTENPIKIRVSPQDYSLLSDSIELDGTAGELEHRFIADKNVQVGGCIIETHRGVVDGRVETQLNTMLSALVAAKSRTRVDE